MQTWELMPRRGIRSGAVELLLGMSRTAARDALAHTMTGPESHLPNEDDFTSEQTGTLIRLRYQGDTLDDIEFLDGDLRLDGIEWVTLSAGIAE